MVDVVCYSGHVAQLSAENRDPVFTVKPELSLIVGDTNVSFAPLDTEIVGVVVMDSPPRQMVLVEYVSLARATTTPEHSTVDGVHSSYFIEAMRVDHVEAALYSPVNQKVQLSNASMLIEL